MKTARLLAAPFARSLSANYLRASVLLCILLANAAPAYGESVVEKWVKRYNGTGNSDDYANAVAVDASGNVIVTGGSNANAISNSDYYTAKYAAADGALIWEKRYDGPSSRSDAASKVAIDGNGDVIVTGNSQGTDPNYHWAEFYTAKYAGADGALLWETRHHEPGSGSNYPTGLALDGNGNVIITGVFSVNTDKDDYYTAKYAASSGALLWERRYNGPGNLDDRPNAVVVDSNGNVIVTGFSTGNGTRGDFYTAKYASADGALLWEKRHDGTASIYDEAYALAVDQSGNVFVTGRSATYHSTGNSDDYYTAKYAAADGALLWERLYDAGYGDFPLAMAVDGDGNVAVTGRSDQSHSTGPVRPDYYTAKYAAADGTLLWEKRYDGPAHYNDAAVAIAVDASGNVVVTGGSVTSGSVMGQIDSTNTDYYTAKYAAANGALLWEMRYRGPDDFNDYASAIALTPDGVVVVTGYSGSGTYPNIRYDYATIKYGPPTPLQSWKLAHLGDANAPDIGDPDHDGLLTLAEYALGLPPETPSQPPGVSVFTYAEGKRLRMFVPRDPAHNDITVSVEATGDLVAGPWTPLATSMLGTPFTGSGYVGGDDATPGVKRVEVRDIVNLSAATQRWLRVKVTH